MAQQAADGVLVIVAGGNVALFADEVRREWVVRPVKLEELERLILGINTPGSGTVGGTIVLRESSVKGSAIRVSFDQIEWSSSQPELADSKKSRSSVTTARQVYDAEDLDSAQVDPRLWELLADKVKKEYQKYEGFVILHGLDTMAYTASALSFMLGNPSVPIVLTGAQRPLNYGRTDAIQNIITSIAIAAGNSLGIHPAVPEVCIYSHDTLFRGNRVTMVSSSSYRSFDSPNYPPLATVGEHIEIHSHVLGRPGGRFTLDYHKDAKARVVIVDVFPGMDSRLISNLAETRGEAYVEVEKGDSQEQIQLKGVLLRTYGMGTAPTSKSFLEALRKLVEAGIVVMNVTQARSGRVAHGSDPVSLRLLEQGVVSGVDMTAEAAYAKMVVMLSEPGDHGDLADSLQVASCGEQTQSLFNLHFEPGATREEGATFFAHLPPAREMVGRHKLRTEDITFAQVRFLGVKPVQRAANVNRSIELKMAFVDRYENKSEIVATLAEDTLRWRPEGRETINVAYDVTHARQHLLHPTTFLQLETSEAVSWTRLCIAIFANVREKS